MAPALKVKNWAKHQHFKDRRPPWIKLYRDILDDIEWNDLDGEDAKTLVMLWLIASENSGVLPDVKTLAFRLRRSAKDVEKQLSRLSGWLISERYQDDINVSQNNSVAELNSSVADIETPLRDREEKSREEIYVDKVDTVVELYHAALPELPSVKLIPEKRKKAILKLWDFVFTSKKSDGEPRATNTQEAIEWIDAYFHRVRDNNFLMGKIGRVGEHSGWQCDLDYLLTEKGMTQVIEKTREAA